MKVGVSEGAMTVTLMKNKKAGAWFDRLKFLMKALEESMVIPDEA